jgi:16S rRNA (cytosine1402-N4)-methyltransferase
LENLEIFLKEIPSLLNQNGTVSVFTFHSLEDRIVKENFKNASKENIYKLLNKKVITPSLDEIRKNPRARSAKLRGAEKL